MKLGEARISATWIKEVFDTSKFCNGGREALMDLIGDAPFVIPDEIERKSTGERWSFSVYDLHSHIMERRPGAADEREPTGEDIKKWLEEHGVDAIRCESCANNARKSPQRFAEDICTPTKNRISSGIYGVWVRSGDIPQEIIDSNPDWLYREEG